MNVLFVQVLWSVVLGGILLGIIFLVSKKSMVSSAKSSPFECGFWPHKSSRVPFSLQFFLIALVFLIFDVELIFLFPLLLADSSLIAASWVSLLVFVLIVGGGLLIEWSQGSLEWLK